VKSANPTTYKAAVELAGSLTDEMVRQGKNQTANKPDNQKFKGNQSNWDTTPKNGNKFGKNGKGKQVEKSKRKFDGNKQAGKSEAGSSEKRYKGNHPYCKKCNKHHTGDCYKCYKCGKLGHGANECDAPPRCFNCGDQGHMKNESTKPNGNKGDGNARARGRAFVLNVEDGKQHADVVTGKFPINNSYAYVLFDSGANRSFISNEFRTRLGKDAQPLDQPYIV